ncbi:AAA family ATPase, partial [Acinetobacter baumannii]
DQLLEMPWEIHSPEQPDLVQAEVSLEREHFGLADVKERVLEFLAVAALKGETPGGALCFVGPPGVGKTGFARALASTLGRPYTRVALGGVRD